MLRGHWPKLFLSWSVGILLVGVHRTRLNYELRNVDALSRLLSDAGSIPAASIPIKNVSNVGTCNLLLEIK